MTARQHILLRAATESDVPLIVSLVHELAEYERLADKCIADDDSVRRALFEDRSAEIVLALLDDNVAGYALFFRSFSTFLMRSGVFLEDLYVRPQFRHQGVGLELLRYLARYAVEKGYPRVEWSVLRWNRLAIDFYEKLGAQPLEDWLSFRLSGEPLERLAEPRSEPA